MWKIKLMSVVAVLLTGATLMSLAYDYADASEPTRYLICEAKMNKLVVGIKDTCAAERKLKRAMRQMKLKPVNCRWEER